MDERDPFTSASAPGPTHLRYSNFDSQMFALGPDVSPEQAKRALEAHLAETNRRIEEAGKLGQALVDQHSQLTDRLKDVDKLQAEGELSPELRVKLAEIEKDYNDVARESARAFLPKSRVTSSETVVAGSPFAPEGKGGGRRSVSPSKFESHGTGSPTKPSIPNRKLRNQPNSTIHDIEFAAEISTSLISQVRSLQTLLAEKEEELRDTKVERSNLEVEAEGFQQRLRTLDESEHRYKDENWNLETQLHELLAEQKDAAGREKKLAQALAILQAEKNTAQRELDEVKVAHAKLAEDQAATAKHHDVELGAAKRAIAMGDNDRMSMQRKIEDLTNQNQELAKAFSMQRGRTLDRDGPSGMSDDEFDTANDNVTPEHSPPPSPVKGTPRHSMLESETLRTSFQHLQRQLQMMRSNMHREKTEKLEIRRMLQESRDEVERLRMRGESAAPVPSKKAKKTESKEFKKPRLNQLGALRIPRNEVYMDDPDWEDQADSPSRSTARISPISKMSRGSLGSLGTPTSGSPAPSTARGRTRDVLPTSESDAFETANETSDAAFETANERGATDTDNFQTGAEEFSGEDTETESLTRGNAGARRAPSIPVSLNQRRNRDSFHSTASTSGDEEDYPSLDMRAPSIFPPPQRMRMRSSRSGLARRSRQTSEDPQLASSPASFAGSLGGGHMMQQSLYAELGDLEGSDEDSFINTPSRRSVRSMTPASVYRGHTASPPPALPPLPRAVMVDAGAQTDSVEIATPRLVLVDSGVAAEQTEYGVPATPTSVLAAGDHSIFADDHSVMTMDSVIGPTDATRSLDPTGDNSIMSTSSVIGPNDAAKRLTVDSAASRPLSSIYSDSSVQFDPEIERKLSLFPAPPLTGVPIIPVPQRLVVSDIEAVVLDPVAEPAIPPPVLALSSIASEAVVPVVEEIPLPPVPELTVSTISSEAVEPVAEPEVSLPDLAISEVVSEAVSPVATPLPVLSVSKVVSETLEPIATPDSPPPTLAVSSVIMEVVEPISEPDTPPPDLSVSSVIMEEVEPVAALEAPKPDAPELSLSSVASQGVEPIAPTEIAVPELSVSNVVSEGVVPITPTKPSLQMSSMIFEGVSPVAAREATLKLSSVMSEDVSPVKPQSPILAMSSLVTEDVEPIAPEEPKPIVPDLSISSLVTEAVEPIAPEEPKAIVPDLSMSSLVTEAVEPITPVEQKPIVPALAMSSLVAESLSPISSPVAPEAPKPDLAFSTIRAEGVTPVSPPSSPPPAAPALGYSTVATMASMSPVEPRSPKRDAFIIPRDRAANTTEPPQTPTQGLFDGFGKRKGPATPVIAEDDTRQSLNNTPRVETPQSQRPLKEVTNNSPTRKPRKAPAAMMASVDKGAQTMVSAEDIDAMADARARGIISTPEKQTLAGAATLGGIAGLSGATPSTIRKRQSEESVGSVIRHKGKGVDGTQILYDNMHRPDSSSSQRGPLEGIPPLPSNHRQVIEAARTGSSHGPGSTTVTSSMGPPTHPASAFRNPALRPRTPTSPTKPLPAAIPPVGSATPRATHTKGEHDVYGTATQRVGSPTRLTDMSRQSSVSSFASEIDNRFHLNNNVVVPPAFAPGSHGFAPGTDPRMIGAITQTMIGEYLWKYTRKATSTRNMSENRHRRYFWVHPYTRTLYWSDRDPSAPGRKPEGRTKGVQIEAVRVVTDDNPYPPGLHRKSLVVISPGRTVKFTCPTGQRHETWFNALSYLLLRTENGQQDTEQLAENITQEDVDEFNPGYTSRHVNGNRPVVPPSLSSYNSRPSGTASPALDISVNYPTLTPQRAAAKRPSQGTLTSRISGYWKAGTFASIRSRSAAPTPSIYEASEVHNSAEDLRQIYEQQDRESDRVENVRACCEGKHDVGTLHVQRGRMGGNGGGNLHGHGHGHGHGYSNSQSTTRTGARSHGHPGTPSTVGSVVGTVAQGTQRSRA